MDFSLYGGLLSLTPALFRGRLYDLTSQVFLRSYGVAFFFFSVTISSSKSTNHERKSTLTPTQRESIPAKSPVPGVDPVVSHSPFDPHHRGNTTGEVYRSHLPTHLDPAMPFHRALDPGKHWV